MAEDKKRPNDEEEERESTASEPSISGQTPYHGDDERTTTDTSVIEDKVRRTKDKQLTGKTEKRRSKCQVCDTIYNDQDTKPTSNNYKHMCKSCRANKRRKDKEKLRNKERICIRCNQKVAEDFRSDGRNHYWHNRCFKCRECRSGIKVSARLVFLRRQPYHEQCLRCNRCGERLEVNQVKQAIVGTNKIYCARCFAKVYNAKCAGCKEEMEGGDVITALNKKYHEGCFKCSRCKTQIDSEYFGVKGKAYCQNCRRYAVALKNRGKRGKSTKKKK